MINKNVFQSVGFSVGAASVLVGTAILSMQNVQTVRADATTDTEKGTT